MPFMRKVQLVLQFGGYSNILTEKHKIDFEINIPTGATYADGTITVTGLTNNDITTMATSYTWESGQVTLLLQPNTILLMAGYKSTLADLTPRYGIIFHGAAMFIKTNLATPDKTISFEVSSEYYANIAKATSISYPVTTLSVVCTQLALEMGKIINFNPLAEKTLNSYKFSGTVSQHIESLRRMFPNIGFSVNNESFTVAPKGQTSLSLPIIIKPEDIIGAPEPTNLGCNVTILLNPLVSINAMVTLTSKKAPYLTGVYTIINIQHSGSTRDAQYYTHLECKRYDFVGPMKQ